MNLVNITDNDLILLYEFISDKKGLTDDELEELINKLEYCTTQIKLRNEFMDKVEEVNKAYQDKLRKEDTNMEEEKKEEVIEEVKAEEVAAPAPTEEVEKADEKVE